MGQYYTACILDKRYDTDPMTVFCPHEWNNGAKLMEHSYEANEMVIAFTEQLVESTENNYCRAAWVGDYSEDTLTDIDYLKTLDPYQISALWQMYVKSWCVNKYGPGDSLERRDMYPLWDEKHPENFELNREPVIIANLDRKEYVVTRPNDHPSNYDWKISRIALLLCFCNHSGGSYHSDVHADMVGRWAGQRLVAGYDTNTISERIAGYIENDGTGKEKKMDFSEFKELDFEFKE